MAPFPGSGVFLRHSNSQSRGCHLFAPSCTRSAALFWGMWLGNGGIRYPLLSPESRWLVPETEIPALQMRKFRLSRTGAELGHNPRSLLWLQAASLSFATRRPPTLPCFPGTGLPAWRGGQVPLLFLEVSVRLSYMTKQSKLGLQVRTTLPGSFLIN